MSVFTRRHLCLLCHRIYSRCSIDVNVVVGTVVVGLDVDIVGGFDTLSKCYILEEIEWTGIVEVGRPLVCGWLG